MIFSAISIFPEMFKSITDYGVTAYAFKENIAKFQCINPRQFTTDNYHKIDDVSFGGGSGMVMKIEPLKLALDATLAWQQELSQATPQVVYMSPQGKVVSQEIVLKLLQNPGLILVCGRYEGIDQRFIDEYVDLELSMGDYVVSGGELPAMMLMDAVIRQMPGVLNSYESLINDSFMQGLLDYPHYTKPRVYKDLSVPDVLLSGNHEAIRIWRLKMSLLNTWQKRPDLLLNRVLNKEEAKILAEIKATLMVKPQ